MGGKLPLIFDCDNTMGVPNHDVDDGLALLYVLGCPEVDLLGVTCSFGNSTQDTVYRNTRRLLQEWGRGDIPVFRGADSPADRRSPAADFLADLARRYSGELNLLVTGSSTNLLGAAERDPEFFSHVKTISLMGGLTGPLLVNGKPMGELNCSVDCEAAYAVLTRGQEIRVATAQNCLDSYFSREEYQAFLADSPAPLARYLEQILSGWFGWNRVRYGQDGFVNWDLMAAAQLIHPELFALEEGTISPSPQSLRTGGLLGDGPTRRVLLPRIKDRTAYTRHAYRTILSAPVDLTGDISKK